MPPEDIVRLGQMLAAIDDASSFISGRTRGDLDSDKMLCFALVHCVEIVGMRNRPVRACFDAEPESSGRPSLANFPHSPHDSARCCRISADRSPAASFTLTP